MDSIEDEKQPSDVSGTRKQDVKKKKRLNWPVIILFVLVAILFGYVGYVFYKNNYAIDENIVEASVTPATIISNSNQSALLTEKIIDNGVEWKTATKLGDLALFKQSEGEFEKKDNCEITVKYFNVGKLDTGGDIITAFVSYGARTENVIRFILKDEKYKIVSQNSDKIDNSVYSLDMQKVDYEDTTVFKSLLIDKVIEEGTTRLTYKFFTSYEGSEEFSSEKFISDTKWGKLYLEQGNKIDENNDLVKAGRYYIKLNDGTKAYYEVSPTFLKDDGTLDIGWDDKTEFQEFLNGECRGTYGSFPLIVDQTAISDKRVIDKNVSKSKVYIPEKAENLLVDFGYSLYEQYNKGDKDSRDTYYSNNGIIIWIDSYGSAIIYSNKIYAPQVEC